MADLSNRILRVALDDAPHARLDKALARVVPETASLSRSQLVRLIEQGAVQREDGSIVTNTKEKTHAGEEFAITLPEAVEIDAQPETIALNVIYEDADLIVVNKPAGMVVHPAPGSESGTLVNALLHHCRDSLSGIGGVKRPGIVHRIDKDTSGLLVVAKTDASHHGLAAQFADHSIDRQYRAVVHGMPTRADPRLAGVSGVAFEDGGVVRISGNIARHKTDRKRMAVVANAGRHAITRLRVDEVLGPQSAPAAALLTCWLETGRTHQIRVHLTHVGHAIVGDPVYGGRRKLSARSLGQDALDRVSLLQRQALHAGVLGFIHPQTGQPLSFSAEVPDDMADVIEALRLPLA